MIAFKKGAFTVAAKEKARGRAGRSHGQPTLLCVSRAATSLTGRSIVHRMFLPQVPVVPVTLDGTGRLMRNKREGQLFGGKVVITVHPPLLSTNADELTAQAQAAIESALEPQFRADKGAPGGGADE